MPSSNLTSNFSSATQISSGDASWSNTGNATVDDGAVASVNIVSPTYTLSNYLKVTDRIQKIPSGATVNGIIVNIELTTIPQAYLSVVVCKGATLSSEVTEQVTLNNTFGNTADLWGLSWTAADVNASDFGVQIRFDRSGFPTADVYVDYIDTIIYYTYTETGDGTGRTTQGRRAIFTSQTNSRVVT
jgi:hypothetical protein